MKARTTRGAAAATPERIVIYRLGSLGDTVVALPCFHKVAERFPSAERIALTNFPVSSKAAPLEAVLQGSGLVHRAMAYPVGVRAPARIWKLARELRRLRADTLVYLTPSRGLAAAWRDVVFFRLCGFRRIIGAPLSRDRQHARRDERGEYERECERLARCLDTLGPIDLADPGAWDLRLSDAERRAGEAVTAAFANRPYLAINMGGKVAKNDWGLANWQAMLRRVTGSCPGFGLLIVGAAEDAERAEAVRPCWSGPVVDACGQLMPRVSAAAMAGAMLFVGHDSGPLHLAAAAGIPCVGLFGDNNPPRLWHPYGDAHRILHRMKGVMSITVDEVVSAVEQRLGVRRGVAAAVPQRQRRDD